MPGDRRPGRAVVRLPVRLRTAGHPGPGRDGRPPRPDGSGASSGSRVLVVYEDTGGGRAALVRGPELVAGSAGTLIVLIVVPEEEPISGCASCRHSAVLWNREMRELAREMQADVAALLGPGEAVEQRIGRGGYLETIIREARREDPETIVIADDRGALRRRLLRDPAARLRAAAGREVVVVRAPANGRSDSRRAPGA